MNLRKIYWLTCCSGENTVNEGGKYSLRIYIPKVSHQHFKQKDNKKWEKINHANIEHKKADSLYSHLTSLQTEKCKTKIRYNTHQSERLKFKRLAISKVEVAMKQLELSPTICWNQKNGTTTLDDSLAGFFPL